MKDEKKKCGLYMRVSTEDQITELQTNVKLAIDLEKRSKKLAEQIKEEKQRKLAKEQKKAKNKSKNKNRNSYSLG